MNKSKNLTDHATEIADFLKQLPEKVNIHGNIDTNVLFIDQKKVDLNKSLKVRNHSPTGFNWGYSGSGPAQSALAILLNYVDAETAQQYYQDLKFGWVAGLPQTDFEVTINLREVMAQILFK